MREIPFSLKGDIYLLPDNASQLPDFSKLKWVGSIYATELNMPKTRFDSGFPGVTGRFEWFAIDYKGELLIPEAGKYKFLITSDDGSRLYMDGKPLIDNDGIHSATTKEASVDLSKGPHKLRLSYFQGPRYYVALVLEIAEQGGAGNTDNIGGPAFNQELSERRAAAVKAALVSRYQIVMGRLSTRGFGLTRPVDTNATEAGRAHNRRVELTRQ